MDSEGQFTDEVPEYKGMFFKSADKEIKAELKKRGRLINDSTLHHSYPHCWRSDTPLMYRAIHCWFIKVTSIKE